MLIQAEDKTILNTQCIRDIWIYKHQFKDNEKKYYDDEGDRINGRFFIYLKIAVRRSLK